LTSLRNHPSLRLKAEMLTWPPMRILPFRLPKGSKYSDLANNIGKICGGGLAENASIGKIYLNAHSSLD
jgi:hypothetical protein